MDVMMDVQRENEFVFCLCMRVEAIIPGNPVGNVFDDFGGDIAERAAKRDDGKMDVGTCMPKLTMAMSLSGSLDQ